MQLKNPKVMTGGAKTAATQQAWGVTSLARTDSEGPRGDSFRSMMLIKYPMCLDLLRGELFN